MFSCKRLLCAILAMIMCFCLIPVTSFAAEQIGFDNFVKRNTFESDTFTDVSEDDWFYDDVKTAYELGLMRGKSENNFNTNSGVTIAETITIAARIHSIYNTGSDYFEASTPWYKAYTDYANSNGIFAYELDDYDKPATRAEFAFILASALPDEALEKVNKVADNAIPDVKTTDTYGDAVYKLYRAGIMVGNDDVGTFAPSAEIKRSEVSAIAARMADTSLRKSVKLGSEYTITFNMNGYGKQISAQTVFEGETATMPSNPGNYAYEFKGWYTKKAGGSLYNFSAPVDGDITLYARWKVNTGFINNTIYDLVNKQSLRTVTFESNGGSEIASQVVVRGECAVAPEDPAKDGYNFAGWFYDEELTAEFDFSKPVSKDMVLYAKWEEIPPEPENYTVSGGASSVDIYSITNLVIDEDANTAVANISAPENCVLIVRFIEEEVYFSEEYPENKVYINETSLYASHVVRGGTDMEDVIADIVGNLPEYYVAEAILMNGNFEALCDPVSYINKTRRYEEFESKSIYDFEDDDVVLNFDESEHENFGVLADDVIILTVDDLTIDENSGIHYIIGAGREINAGDKLFIDDGEDTALIRVSSVKMKSQFYEVLPARVDDEVFGYELVDFYEFLKVDMDYEGEMVSADPEESAYYSEYEVMPMVDIIDVNKNAEVGLSVNPITFETNHFRATGKVGGKISAKLVMEYDAKLFKKDYMRCDFTVTTDLNANITVVAKWGTENNKELEEYLKNHTEEKEFKLGKVTIPFGVTGLSAFADIRACIEWQITAGLELNGNIKTTHGFKYNTKDGYQKVDKKNCNWSVNCKGHAEISFGPKPSIGVEFLGGVISAEVGCFFGAKAEANAVIPVFQGGDSRHACHLCIDGSLKLVISVDAKLKYNITKKFKGTPIDINILTLEKPLFEFYISLINEADSMFGGKVALGKGSCPNESFKTTFITNDANGNTVSTNVTVTNKATNNVVGTVASGDYEYLHEGNYTATAKIGSSTVTRTFTVTDVAQTVKLTETTRDGEISGLIKSADDGTGIEGATISVYKSGVLCGSDTTDTEGNYRISLAEGSYKYEITADGYVSTSGYFEINDGETKYMEATLMSRDDDDVIMGGVYGTIKDAQTGLPLKGVKIKIYSGINNTSGTSAAIDGHLNTDSNGNYSYKTWSIFGVSFGLPCGNYTVELSKEGYITTTFNIVIVGGTDIEFNGSISPVTADNEYRVVLTWGYTPSDLDSHYIAMTTGGSVDHVFYSRMHGYSAKLDTDDVTSYGPETIYITHFNTTDGFYYSVHDYSNRNSSTSKQLSNSGAKVELYRGGLLIATYYVPSDRGGTVWNVFSVSATGAVTPINTMEYISSPGSVGSSFIKK